MVQIFDVVTFRVNQSMSHFGLCSRYKKIVSFASLCTNDRMESVLPLGMFKVLDAPTDKDFIDIGRWTRLHEIKYDAL